MMKYILLSLILTLVGCATAPETDQTRVISVTNDNCYIDGQSIEIDEISETLRSTDHIQIQVDKTTLHKRVISVLEEVAAANVKDMRFATTE